MLECGTAAEGNTCTMLALVCLLCRLLSALGPGPWGSDGTASSPGLQSLFSGGTHT